MLSRVAESIFWMSRYVERAENTARFVDVTLNMLLDQPHQAEELQWQPLVSTTGDVELFEEKYAGATADNVIHFLTFDRDYCNSILSSLYAARENARSVRESISSEMWEQLNGYYHFVRAASQAQAMPSPSEFFQQVKQQSHLFNGITDATLPRGKGWNLFNLGRLLERADKTSRILDVKYFTLLPSVIDVGTPIDDLQWSAVLRSVSGFEAYRKRYHGITVERIVEFLVLDRAFPRSIQHCVIHADTSLHEFSGSPLGSFSNPAEQRFGRLRSELAYSDVREIIDGGLHEFIDRLQVRLNEIGTAIHDTYFALRPIETGSSQSQMQRQL